MLASATTRGEVRPPSPRPPRASLGLRAAALALALPAAAGAQATAASESRIVLAHQLLGAAGRALGTSGDATAASVGQVAAGPAAASASYRLHAGVAWTPPEVVGANPILAGALERSGPQGGGNTVELVGFNFLAPGAGPLAVDFGAQPGTGTVVLGNTHATTTAPGEVDADGNPPPEVELSVSNLHGTASGKATAFTPSYLYEPALTRAELPRIGRRTHLHVNGAVDGLLILVLGQPMTGVAVPIPPIDGAVVVLINPQTAVPPSTMPFGHYEHVIDVPDDPALIGADLTYQGLVLEDVALLLGAFTNPLTLLVQP